MGIEEEDGQENPTLPKSLRYREYSCERYPWHYNSVSEKTDTTP